MFGGGADFSGLICSQYGVDGLPVAPGKMVDFLHIKDGCLNKWFGLNNLISD